MIKWGEMMQKPKVAFICVHNSCRSQMAEAIAKLWAAEVFDAYSAGTETKPQSTRRQLPLFRNCTVWT